MCISKNRGTNNAPLDSWESGSWIFLNFQIMGSSGLPPSYMGISKNRGGFTPQIIPF